MSAEYSARSAAKVTSKLGAAGTLCRTENKWMAKWRNLAFGKNLALQKMLKLE